MKKLNESVLRVGDIILTTTNMVVSRVIRSFTKSDISHAMIYVDAYSVIDATAEGVQSRNTQRILFDEECSVHVLRLKTKLSEQQIKEICDYVRQRIGTSYALREAVLTAIGGSKDWTRKQFCSRLVAQAYASVGHILVPDPNYCAPEDLQRSPLLFEVADAVVGISDEDIRQWSEISDVPQLMRDATNAVLKGARQKKKAILSLNYIDQHLFEHPEDDQYFYDLFVSSGYLEVWQVEESKNPWHYDLELMSSVNAPEGAVEAYCRSTIRENGTDRFVINRDGYVAMCQKYKLRTFRLLAELYEKIAQNHQVRLGVARQWLALQTDEGSDDKASTFELVPHTPAWFLALQTRNPAQAAMSWMVTERAGSLEVCSVCGDDPASDYKLDKPGLPADAVTTLRLCDDCLKIRRAGGELFRPLGER